MAIPVKATAHGTLEPPFLSNILSGGDKPDYSRQVVGISRIAIKNFNRVAASHDRMVAMNESSGLEPTSDLVRQSSKDAISGLKEFAKGRGVSVFA